MSLMIEKMTAPTDEVRALILGLEEELSPHYEPHQRHGLKLEAIFQPGIHFFLARRSGEPSGWSFASVRNSGSATRARGAGSYNELARSPEPVE